ncbi:ribosomal RNA small subunit methyltransferase A [Candidatus Peregrinibacteria bacterium CG10_big_fil_rev_8_21_14_0_10_49_24]|nr:MAG: ribosomal RNA small subunit methyltransferase A [Candidatus Peregrinibacteria bacterium CG11_big_fil_rev_8_21_14_0_20_49_14]PIR50894.1 MAG: ribosomal RNA small subunit methyltransferase A [Candidatus Peregrinibacteria bacterium CG10_big_fil_rev_8_21_14_0_10_49_24]PJA67171.1 MAG: ribosomal RNA small subunit methyltransferase A [Candidatus Peregrinibacteria bacterium CG_4_9_14_3_um_filter_49_12]
MTSLRDEIRQFCNTYALRLNTDLGQHFLTDEEVLSTIVEAPNIQRTDTIVEIGPGIGVLTKELLARAGKVFAIELDERLIPILETYVKDDPKLEVVQGNALRVPLPDHPYKIVANIPYHITSPLLRHAFLESAVHPDCMTLLIQKEVAEKICDTNHAGILTILVGLFGTPEILIDVPPQAFLPPPKVDSAVLHIECHKEPLADAKTLQKVFSLTKIAFSQKRKMLSNTLGKLPGGEHLLETAGIDPTRRPETLQIQEWITLARSTKE